MRSSARGSGWDSTTRAGALDWLFGGAAPRLARARSAAPRHQGDALDDVRVHADPARELARQDGLRNLGRYGIRWRQADTRKTSVGDRAKPAGTGVALLPQRLAGPWAGRDRPVRADALARRTGA
jgi:hypothetical protein